MDTKQKTKPDIIVDTNPRVGSCVDCKVIKKVIVTYEIHPAGGDSKSFNGLPFVAAVNGGVLSLYKKMPGKSEKPSLVFKTEEVDIGAKVNIYLGSDAKAIYRKVPLYEVTTGENNILVVIKEKRGKHSNDTDKPVFIETKGNVDIYHAPLTGDIWMKFSHAFTSGEVSDLVPTSMSKLAVQAVKDIYDGKFDAGKGAALTIPFEHPLKLVWSSSDNAKANISQFDERKDIHTRVNPRTYAALIQAAENAKIDEVHLSSGWRPMLGSVLHRIGLGLDVNVIVKDKKSTAVRRNSPTKNALARADAELKSALKANDPEKIKEAKAHVAALKKDYPANIKKEAESTDPSDYAAFRAELSHSKDIVRQIFDPWKMDRNTSDNLLAEANTLATLNEKLHSNHLHVTAVDADLGYAPMSNNKLAIQK